MASTTVDSIQNVEIFYEVFPRLLPRDTIFIHGNIASRRWWYPLRDELKKHSSSESASGSMIVVDFRGCGQSTPPRSQDDINMKLFARDFVQVARDISAGPFDLVGHSTGGLIAALMLADSPALFRRALMLDPVGAQGVKFEPSMTAAFEAMKTNRDLVATVIGSTIHNNQPQSDFFQQVIVPDAFQAVQTVGEGVLRALDGLDVRTLLSPLSHQVQVFHGEFDQLLPRQASEDLAKLFRNGLFEVLPGVGHCANIENPKLLSERLLKFLS